MIMLAPETLQQIPFKEFNIHVDDIIKYEDLLVKKPEYKSKSIIENQEFILGVYIHVYNKQHDDTNDENEVKTFECPICLEKIKKDTKLSVTKCGKLML